MISASARRVARREIQVSSSKWDLSSAANSASSAAKDAAIRRRCNFYTRRAQRCRMDQQHCAAGRVRRGDARGKDVAAAVS